MSIQSKRFPDLSNHSFSIKSQIKGPQAQKQFDHKTVTNRPMLGNSDAAMLMGIAG